MANSRARGNDRGRDRELGSGIEPLRREAEMGKGRDKAAKATKKATKREIQLHIKEDRKISQQEYEGWLTRQASPDEGFLAELFEIDEAPQVPVHDNALNDPAADQVNGAAAADAVPHHLPLVGDDVQN